ncbi:MAG: hypothetical protein GY937_20560 [bacterium]|nr:hypothetical protein [bacterium]
MACKLTAKRDVRRLVHGYFESKYTNPENVTDQTKMTAFGATKVRLRKDHRNIGQRVRRKGCTMKTFDPGEFLACKKVGDVVKGAWQAVEDNR